MSRANFISKISGVEFYPTSDAELIARAAVMVTNKNQFVNEGPEPHGIYDSRLGTIYSKYECSTCSQGIRGCPGHNGVYHLKFPLCHLISMPTAFKFLKIICVHCNRFIMNPEKVDYGFSPMNSVDEILAFIIDKKIKLDKKKKIYCDYCNESGDNITVVQPKYSNSSINDQNHTKVKRINNGDGYKYANENDYEKTMYNHEILALFEGLSDKELAKFGIPIKCHPRNFYTRVLNILPANMRFINNDNKNTYSNQHTACIEKIIKANSEMPGEVPSKKDTVAFGAYINKADELIKLYVEYLKVKTNGDSNDTIYSKLKGKKGITRTSQLGKNVGKVFRVVIICDITCPIDTIRIPKKFATVLTIDETVTEYNYDKMLKIFNNGPNYPGYNEITSIANGKKYDSRSTSYKLRVGDIIHRHVVDGDSVPFHRFPTLTATCTTNMKILIYKDATEAVGFNVLACDLFNADYDGDTMMGFVIGNEAIRFEVQHIMNMNNNYLEGKVTAGSNAFMLGQVLDSVMGFALITRNFVKFTRYEVMDLIRDIPINQLLTQEEYTGREVMSLVMPRIKYSAPSPFFANKLINQFMSFRKPGEERTGDDDTRFDESDKEVKIMDGKILSGILCGKIIKGNPNSIYHVICDQHGAEIANKIIFYHQQIAKRYLEVNCFSIGYKDLVISDEAKKKIDLTQCRILAQISELKNKVINGNIQVPTGKDIRSYVEELRLKIHAEAEHAYLHAILQGMKPEENSIFLGVLTGAKGKLNNIYNMFAPLGQIKIDGKRILSTLDYQRYDICNPQFSMDARVGGYVNKSYTSGIPPGSMYTVSKNARNNVLTKGLVVGEAGAAGRDIIKVSEALLVDNRMFTVRNYGENILEFAVADDGFESSTLIANPYFILDKTDEEVKTMFQPKYPNKLVDKAVNSILADRKEFLEIQVAKEATNYTYEASKSLKVPFNIEQMIYIVTGDKTHEPTKDEYENMLILVDNFLRDVHYVKVNIAQQKKQTKLLKTTELTMTAVRMALRLYFNPAFLGTIRMEWLEVLLNDITCKLINVLYLPGKNIGTVTGQTLTAPLTQYLIDAHHAAATGGTSRQGLKYYKQVTNLKQMNKMADEYKRMYIYLKEKYEEDESNAQKLIDYIVTINFKFFIQRLDILAERIGECITYPEDATIYKDKTVIDDIKKQGIYPFTFRYVLDAKKMDLKNVTMLKLVSTIEKYFNGMAFCTYKRQNDNHILHMFFSSQFEFIYPIGSKTKKAPSNVWNQIADFADKFNKDFIINSFPGIISAMIKSRNKTFIKDDGSLGKKKIYYVQTNGINMKNVLLLNVVDKSRTSCSHVVETFNYFGLLSARDKFISEISNTFITLDLSPNNYVFPANVMFERGFPTNLTEKGQKIREPHDSLLHSAFKNPIGALRSAMVNNVHNPLSSPSSNLMMGQIMELGTSYNKLIFNEKFINAHKTSEVEDFI